VHGNFGRPVNPKLMRGMVTKSSKSAKAAAQARAARRSRLAVAKLVGEVDDLLMRRHARVSTSSSPSILEQSSPGARGAAARARHTAIVQRWRKGF
jgi:hypothetical protein